MIVRRRSPWRVIWNFCRAKWSNSDARLVELPVQSPAQFRRSVAKEVARCQRRPAWNEFGLVILTCDWTQQIAATERLVRQMKNRLRITDEIGWWGDQLAVLLPETDRDGALFVANWIEASGCELGLTITSEVLMYPRDDSIGGKSQELWSSGGTPNEFPREPAVGISSDVERRAKGKREFPYFVPRATPMPMWKRAIDLAGASLGLVLFAPFFLATIWLIRRDSKGPAVFVQWREGLGGKPFRMYKFRTMQMDAELIQNELRRFNEQDGPAFKLAEDPRVTRVGRWLRRTGLDELPQLWNVFRGEMSLVGPRPLPMSESARCAMWQRERLSVVPGITCIWQVTGGRSVSFDEWMRMDLDYVKRRGLWLDVKLIWATLMMALRRRASV